MARIRTIKPAFFSSLTITSLPKTTRLTFIGLWCYADDAGRAVDDPRLVKAEIWPLDDDYTVRKIEADLTAITAAGLIERYQIGGRRYLRIVGMGEHQRINRPQQSKLPPPTDHRPLTEDSLNDQVTGTAPGMNGHGRVTENSPPEGKGREGITPQPPAERGADDAHAGQHPNCRACGTNRRPAAPPPAPPDPLAGQREALLANAEANTAKVRAINAEPPDPNAATRAADLRNRLRPPPVDDDTQGNR